MINSYLQNNHLTNELIGLKEKSDEEILQLISNININDDVLASNYTHGQVYFKISGYNKNYY